MGASCWSYVVPYAGDVERALRDLRARVFANRAYLDRRPQLAQSIPRLVEMMTAAGLDKAQLDAMVAEVKAASEAPDPETIEELLEMNAESGTHSILDIEGISTKAKAFRAAPLTAAQLTRIFGSERPTRDNAEAAVHEIWELRERCYATYVLLYDAKGAPTEILFAGCSGD